MRWADRKRRLLSVRDIGRRHVDQDLVARDSHADSLDRRFDPVLTLLDGAVGQSANVNTTPLAYIDLHGDGPRVDAVNGAAKCFRYH